MGKRNTELIIAALRKKGETGKAAQMAQRYSQGGKTDWYLPSRDELNLMYVNLKQNSTGGFSNGLYWSSSAYNTDYAWRQNFSDGSQECYYESYSHSVRAVRQF
jgi:hypothetical protein